MNDVLTDNSCFFEMLSSIYKATGVLYPSEKSIKILSFDDKSECISEKIKIDEFFSLFGEVDFGEKKKIVDFINDSSTSAPVRDSAVRMCFAVQEKSNIYARYVVALYASVKHGKYFITVSKVWDSSDSITLMFKKHAVDIRLSDIIYVDYGNHSVEVHSTSGKESFFSVSFADVAEKLLEKQNFLRSYKNCIVNMDRISYVEDDSFIMDNGVKISIPKRRLREIIKAYNDYVLINRF